MGPSSSNLLPRLVAVLERRLSPAQLADDVVRRRALLILGTAWIVMSSCALAVPVLALTTRAEGRAALIGGDLATLALLGVGHWLLRRGHTAAAGNCLAAALLGGTLYAVARTGSFASPFFIILALVPFLAGQMVGRVAGLAWTGVTLAAIVVMAVAAGMGAGPPEFHDPEGYAAAAAFYGFMTVAVIAALGHLAELARDAAVARAEAAATQLEQADLEVERARILAHQAVAADTAKSAFMATMSHELRTPLNAVIGYAEMLAEDADEQGLQAMHADLVKILGASQHLLGLIEDVLKIARVEAEKSDMRRERVDAGAVALEVVAALQPLARSRGDVLEVRGPAAPVYAQLDRGRLRQVLLNLVGNALKFTVRGRVTVHVRREAEDLAHHLVIEVEDTGIGIRRTDHDRIFEPFTQVDSSVRRRYEGSGLGLTLCKSLVEMMGGRIAVRSQVGRGSVFTVRLPAEPPARYEPVAQDVAC
jgi:signal transduction histidine kinase